MKKLLINTTCFPNQNNSYYGGMFIKNELSELSNYFDEVNVIVPTAFGTKESKMCKDYSIGNVNVYFPRYLQMPLKSFRKLSGDVHYKLIEETIKKHNIEFDLIYSHVMWQAGYAGVKLKKKYRVPLICVGHGSDVRTPLTTKGIWQKDKLDYVMKHADTVLVNHEEIEKLLLDDYKEYSYKIKYNYKGVDLKKKEKRIINKYKFVVLFIGNMNNFKDPLTFMNAADILVNTLQKKDIHFKIVGSGPLFYECWKYANKSGLNDNITLCENATNVWNYYNNCDVCCNISPIENIWSTTLQEALCMGKPCIVTDVGYTKKILHDNKDCLMIEKQKPEQLAEAILKLKRDDKLRTRLSNTKWKKEFDIEKTTKKLISIMRKTKCH